MSGRGGGAWWRAVRVHAVVVVSSSLAACATASLGAPREPAAVARQPETRLVTHVRVVEEGPCRIPGRPELDGQTRVRLVYVEWPAFSEELCSSDLAAHLRRSGSRDVAATVTFTARGHALCAVDGIEATRLERGCSWEGVVSGGFASYGHTTQGEGGLREEDLPPWEADRR